MNNQLFEYKCPHCDEEEEIELDKCPPLDEEGYDVKCYCDGHYRLQFYTDLKINTFPICAICKCEIDDNRYFCKKCEKNNEEEKE